MNPQVIRINENSWRLEDEGVRFFLLTGSRCALLIDSGRSVHNARDVASGLTTLPLSLLNTHADHDHIGSNGQFEEFYMHPAEQANYHRSGQSGRIRPVAEGDVIDLGERELRIIHLPGHTPGSIAVLDVSRRVLISGDPVQDGLIFMFGEFRDMPDYIKSLEHLLEFKGYFDEIWPSHGSIPVYPELIVKLRDGARAILAGGVSGRADSVYGTPVHSFDLGFATFLCDQGRYLP